MLEQLSKEEQEIISYVESGKTQSVDNVEEEMARYRKMAQEYSSKKKAISIRLAESDLYLLKQKALATGLSYQNIIQSLIHQYTHDKIKVGL
jgi:predicted DNA binding CopG/RHH family protein